MTERPSNIDFKYNLKIYYELLKRYKGLFISILILVLFIEATYTVDKFMFKSVVDNGTLFAANSLPKESFVNILILITILFSILILLRAIAKWIFIHLINRLDGNLIVDLKRKFFNHIINLSHTFHTTHRTGS